MFSRILLLVLAVNGEGGAGNIPEELNKAGASMLCNMVAMAGLEETLSGEGPFTIFAPINEAFAKVPLDIVKALITDTELLKQVLLTHVVPGAVLSSDLTNDQLAETAAANSLRINIYSKLPNYTPFVTVNGKRVEKADVEASNGVIHFISDVIYPLPTTNTMADLLSTDERFSTLWAALGAANLSEVASSEGPFTMFAPTNDAFAKIPEDALAELLADPEALSVILLRHGVPGTIYKEGLSWRTHQTAGEEKIATQTYQNDTVKVLSYTILETEGSGDPEGSGEGSGEPVKAGLDNEAFVVDFDFPISNGVVHSIDTVL